MNKPILRCAIYTRVSSDQGLEQDFNSLDAQREAAEAYIKSQAHEGWRLVRDHFDDGGFSGGSMERPALKELMQRIEDRRIDIVVVYKVDRLTRSLADFAKLVELFDAQKVAFVSVTQAFNTTSSMGRLTLNVLLSFAQFEREVTGERIRDKIAASKKKGLWMGGNVPFGYRVKDRKLLVEEKEAAVVKAIFDLYLDLGSIPAVQRELRAKGLRSRVRVSVTGRETGGIPFTNGPLSHILRNRHYIGELNHKGRSWPGEHLGIVDPNTFEQVQQKLASQRQRRSTHVLSSNSLLMGKIFNSAGERMTPNYVVKKGVRYRYYLATSVVQGRKDRTSSIRRLPAEPVEALVIRAMKDLVDIGRENGLGANFSEAELIAIYLDRATIHEKSIEISFRDPDERVRTHTIPWEKPSSIRRRQILISEAPAKNLRHIRVDEQARLLRAIGLARRWVQEMIEGSVPDTTALAVREGKTERSIRMSLSLAFLDPALVRAACEGTLPRGYGVSRLVELPQAFDDQWPALGLARPKVDSHTGSLKPLLNE